MPDHDTIMQNIWLVGGISLGGGVFASQAAGIAGDMRFSVKLLVTVGVAVIILATMYFLAPAHA